MIRELSEPAPVAADAEMEHEPQETTELHRIDPGIVSLGCADFGGDVEIVVRGCQSETQALRKANAFLEHWNRDASR